MQCKNINKNGFFVLKNAGKYEDYSSVLGKDIYAPERPASDNKGWDNFESEDEVWTKDVNGGGLYYMRHCHIV